MIEWQRNTVGARPEQACDLCNGTKEVTVNTKLMECFRCKGTGNVFIGDKSETVRVEYWALDPKTSERVGIMTEAGYNLLMEDLNNANP